MVVGALFVFPGAKQWAFQHTAAWAIATSSPTW